MMVSRLVKFNLPFTIPNNQLVWTNHASQRMEERKIKLPEKRSRWELVENRKHFEKSTWSLRLRQKKSQDLIIVVEKTEEYKYVVITCYWDEKAAA